MALLATAAVPTYFTPLLKDGKTYIDGGLLAVNPSKKVAEKAIALSADKGGSGEKGKAVILSIGTGVWPSEPKNVIEKCMLE